MKLLPHTKLHGLFDYFTIVFLLIAPTIFSLHPSIAMLTYLLALIQAVLAVCTKYPYGFFKWIPFSLHGKVELMIAGVLALVPFFATNIDHNEGLYFFWMLAFVYSLVFALTDFNAQWEEKLSG